MNRNQGFTLMEILVVSAIMAILLAVMIPNMSSARRNAMSRTTQAYGANVYVAINGYLGIHPQVTARTLVTTGFLGINLTSTKFPLDTAHDLYPKTNFRSCAEGYTLDYNAGMVGVRRTDVVDDSRSFSWPRSDSRVRCALVAYQDTNIGSTTSSNAYSVAVYTWDTLNPSKVYVNGKSL